MIQLETHDAPPAEGKGEEEGATFRSQDDMELEATHLAKFFT
jgi:hypothetical protein